MSNDNSNFWDELGSDEVSEFALLEETEETEDQAEANYYDHEDIDEDIVEEIEESSAFELDDRETAVIYNARLRLEQAKLYEMLINHNLFEGVDASQQAIQNVSNELKEYIVERLEILMGMRKEKTVIPDEIEVSFEGEFNDVEKDFLKQLAFKGTKGTSTSGVMERKTQTIKPVSQAPSGGLKPLVKHEVAVREPVAKKAPARRKPKAAAKPAPKPTRRAKPKKTATVSKRKSSVKNTSHGPREMNKGEIEQLAKEDLQRDIEILKGKKNWKKLSPEEKAKKLADNTSMTNKGRIPTPTQEQINMHYQTNSQNRLVGGNEKSQFNTMLASALAAQKNREE